MKLLATSRAAILAVIGVCLLGVTCYGQKDVDDTSNKCAITQKNSEGWKRYYLEGQNEDAICIYLPKKPDKFPGGKLRGSDIPVTADFYLVSDDQEIYAVAFLYDLPTKTEDMPDAQKAELFFGTWRGTIERVRPALEKASGTPVDVKYTEQNKVNVRGHEGRVQLFKVGQYLGQARILFVEKKAYLLMGLWPPDRAQKRSSAFFDYFETRIKQ